MSRPSARRRILGVDYGTARIGLAVSDLTATLAGGIESIRWNGRNWQLVLDRLKVIVEAREIGEVVIGLPRRTDGRHSVSEEGARQLGLLITEQLGVPVCYVDERFTTVIAGRLLREAGRKPSTSRAIIDQVAAELILQGVLDRRRQENRGCAIIADDKPPDKLAGVAGNGWYESRQEGSKMTSDENLDIQNQVRDDAGSAPAERDCQCGEPGCDCSSGTDSDCCDDACCDGEDCYDDACCGDKGCEDDACCGDKGCEDDACCGDKGCDGDHQPGCGCGDDESLDSEDGSVITMTDTETGEEFKFLLADDFVFEDESYCVLVSTDDAEDQEMVIARVVSMVDGSEGLETLEDDEYDRVYAEYERLCEEDEFEEDEEDEETDDTDEDFRAGTKRKD